MAQTGDTWQMSIDNTYNFTTNGKFDTREAVVTCARDIGNANKVLLLLG
jgi:hypothetical protein